ncbi:MAG: pseudouridine-5-phosphate glycosidase [Anaerolineales bacterium]|nr:pseudouridine-5-phosphate glycosidase [Anaerolineales bacterium]
MPNHAPNWLKIHPEVAAALTNGQPVVALESAVVTHGLPYPENLVIAKQMEDLVRTAGAQPATVVLLDGRIHLGISSPMLERLVDSPDPEKISLRDLASATVKGKTGGTTVATTMYVAHMAGVAVFGTGGIGGVHRGESGDVSADLSALATLPVALVCSGAKAILDLPRTLEWLETAGVPILGWGTDEFPAFFSRRSGLPVDARVDHAQEAATVVRAHWDMGLKTGLLICVPCPEEDVIPWDELSKALEQAEADAKASALSGKAITPFLLRRLSELTGGATLRANLTLLRNNARAAAELAKELALQAT